MGAVFGVSAVVERGERRSAAGFAEQKPKEKRAAEKARNDADRKNAREENDSRKRVANGEKKRAAEKRRRDQTSGVASDAKASDVRNGQPDETDRPAKSDDDGDERARQQEERGAESVDFDAERTGPVVAERQRVEFPGTAIKERGGDGENGRGRRQIPGFAKVDAAGRPTDRRERFRRIREVLLT